MGARKKTTAKKKTTSRAMPKTLGAAIDAYSDLRDERLELSRRVDEMKEREALHRQNCIKLLRKAKLTKGSGVKATCSIKADAVPVVTDWEAFHAFVAKEDAFDLLQRRLNPAAFRDRWEEGVTIEGTKTETVLKVSLTTLRRGK
jgi:hypothetical protein